MKSHGIWVLALLEEMKRRPGYETPGLTSRDFGVKKWEKSVQLLFYQIMIHHIVQIDLDFNLFLFLSPENDDVHVGEA